MVASPAATSSERAELAPIEDADIDAVARFLQAEIGRGIPLEAWADAMRPPWAADRPNAGYLLRAGGSIVGAYIATYSERAIDGQRMSFCNLGPWCVLEEHRFQSLALLQALLAQPGYQFTDLSPESHVFRLNRRLGFEPLDTAASLVATFRPTRPRRASITSDPAEIERILEGEDLQVFRDHAGARAVEHFVLSQGERSCYAVLRRKRRGRWRSLTLLHASDPELFLRLIGRFGHHLLWRHRVVWLIVEHRLVGSSPPGARSIEGQQRMFRSEELGADRIDYLYSEIVCVPSSEDWASESA